MHELSIAISIVEMAEEEAQRHGGQVSAIYLKIGALSGVVKEALLSSFEMASAGTPLEGSRLVVEEVPIVAFCSHCQTNRTLTSAQWFCCPECGAPTPEVLQGKDLEVVALEMTDDVRAQAG